MEKDTKRERKTWRKTHRERHGERHRERERQRERQREFKFPSRKCMMFFFCFFDMLNTGNPLCSVISHAGALTCHALFY